MLDKIYYTVHVCDDNDAYNDIEKWITNQTDILKRSKEVILSRKSRMTRRYYRNKPGSERGASFTPSVNECHVFRRNGCLFWFRLYGGRVDMALRRVCGNMHTPMKVISITCFWFNAPVLNKLLTDAIRDSEHVERKLTKMYSFDQNAYGWENSSQTNVRSWSTIDMPKRIKKDILADVQRFLNNYDWYMEKGISHRRGYLLYGNPGNGKTSLIKAIAGKIQSSIYVLRLSNSNLNDQSLVRLLNRSGVFIIEDVDSIFQSDNDDKREMSCNVTFSGLLNAIDGVDGSTGRILFMTTNHKDKLDPALIRPGRIDRQFYIPDANEETIASMFGRFFGASRAVSQTFAQQLIQDTSHKFSMSLLQEFFISNQDATITEMFEKTSSFEEIVARRVIDSYRKI